MFVCMMRAICKRTHHVFVFLTRQKPAAESLYRNELTQHNAAHTYIIWARSLHTSCIHPSIYKFIRAHAVLHTL